MMDGSMVVTDRRYYYANTLAAVIAELGIPERTKPVQMEGSAIDVSHVAWMTILVARLNVRNASASKEAGTWVRRILQAMEYFGYWDRERSNSLLNLDKEQHFHLTVGN